MTKTKKYNNYGLTLGEIKLIEFQNGMSGSFYNALFIAISKADNENLNKLKLSFPEEVEAYINYINTPGYWEDLKQKYEFSKK